MTPSFSMSVGAHPAGFFSSPCGPSSGGTVSLASRMSTTIEHGVLVADAEVGAATLAEGVVGAA